MPRTPKSGDTATVNERPLVTSSAASAQTLRVTVSLLDGLRDTRGRGVRPQFLHLRRPRAATPRRLHAHKGRDPRPATRGPRTPLPASASASAAVDPRANPRHGCRNPSRSDTRRPATHPPPPPRRPPGAVTPTHPPQTADKHHQRPDPYPPRRRTRTGTARARHGTARHGTAPARHGARARKPSGTRAVRSRSRAGGFRPPGARRRFTTRPAADCVDQPPVTTKGRLRSGGGR